MVILKGNTAISKNLRKLKKKTLRYLRQFRRSFKDPFLCLTVFLTILFLILSLQVSDSESYLKVASFSFQLQRRKPSQNLYLRSGQGFSFDSPDFLLVQQSILMASTPPVMVTPQVLGEILGSLVESETRQEIVEYEVETGDSLWSIAQKFNISIDTVIWANDIKNAIIRPGQKLLILPVSGVMHLVKEGDTVSELAKKYKTDVEKIMAFNDLSLDLDIMPEEILIIPDGQVPSFSSIATIPTNSLANLSTNNFYGQSHDFPYGQCTWWVAQKRAIPGWGHAKNWLAMAEAAGFAVCKGRYCVPQAGAVISLSGDRNYGHVAYVEQVKGDKVTFSETNYIGWGRLNYRTLRVGSSSIIGYIY